MKKKLLAATICTGVLLLSSSRVLAISPETGPQRLGVQGLDQRPEGLEESTAEETGKLTDKIRLAGVVEIEAAYTRATDQSGSTTDDSDLALATAALLFDAAINDRVTAHTALLYEEGEEIDHLVVDEGFISISPVGPLGLAVGKMYLPFGSFESRFITDPITLTIGETNDTALAASFNNDRLEVSAAIFRGAIKENGEEDEIDNLAGRVVYNLPEEISPGLGLRIGASYSSNLAASDTLQAITITPGEVTDQVAGVSGFISVSLADLLFLEAEYLGALADFALADLTFVDADNRRPAAWNIEIGAEVMADLELALKYEGCAEFGAEAPEKQYGAALLYRLYVDTSLGLEYLAGEFIDDSDSDRITMQLAVEF